MGSFSHKCILGADFIVLAHQIAAIAGNYVNFGVFELYGDRALSDALDIALKMTLSIPLADILAFRKVCISLMNFWFLVGRDIPLFQMDYLLNLFKVLMNTWTSDNNNFHNTTNSHSHTISGTTHTNITKIHNREPVMKATPMGENCISRI